MCWTRLENLMANLTQNRPGVLGWSGFYIVLVGLYVIGIVALVVQSIRESKEASLAQRGRLLLSGLLLLGLLRGILYSTLNPPWIAPDEPSHLEYARLLSDLRRVPAREDISPDVQRQILASMYVFDFWQYNNMVKPDHPPLAFGGGLGGDWQGIPPTFVIDDRFLWYVPQVGNEPPLYYVLALPAFWSVLSGDSVLLQLYWMRWITMLLYILCVATTFLVGRLVLRDIRGGALGAAALVLFQPMLGYIGTAANNDLVGAALGTIWFAAVAHVFLRGWSWKTGAFLVTLMLLSVWGKKTTYFLFPLSVLVLGLYYWSRHTLRPAFQLAIVLMVLATVGGGIGLIGPSPEQPDMWLTRPTPQIGARTDLRAYDGSHSFQLSATLPGEELRLAQTVSGSMVVSLRGQKVVLEALVSGESDDQRGRLRLVDNTGKHELPFVVGTGWQRVSMTYTVPSNAQFMRIQLLPGHDVGEERDRVYFDAVSLHIAGVSPAESLVRNGSAEEPASRFRTVAMNVAQALGLTGYLVPWFMQPSSNDWLELLPAAADFAVSSFWGRFGSLKVVMPPLWDVVWKCASLAALLGLTLCFFKRVSIERERRFYFGVLIIGVVVIGIQVMLPLLRRPDPHWLPQGRFLFPAIMPVALLLYLGWSSLFPARLRPWLLPWVVVGAAMMDVVAMVTLVAYSYCRV